MATVDLGIVYEPHPQELADLRAALAALLGIEPGQERVFGYDGPNDVVQLLLDAATWQNALIVLAASFGGRSQQVLEKSLANWLPLKCGRKRRTITTP